MPDKLSKKKSSRHSIITSVKDVEFEERDDRVTYMSSNKKQEMEFFGSAPPNSKLAATLAQVAAAVQADNLPRFKDSPRRLTSGAQARGQIQGAQASVTYKYEEGYVPGVYTDEYRDEEDYAQSQKFADPEEQNHPRSQENSAYQSSLASTPRSNTTFTAGTRHELEQKVAYHAKGPNGELYVSAPTGSNEAQLFDEMARRISNSNERSSGSKSKGKHHKSKSRGWLLGW